MIIEYVLLVVLFLAEFNVLCWVLTIFNRQVVPQSDVQFFIQFDTQYVVQWT